MITQLITVLALIAVTSISAFTLVTPACSSHLRCTRDSNSKLYMARSFKPTDPFAFKIKSKKTSKYNMPGYARGDLDNLKIVFNLYSHTEAQVPSLSLESFLRSKYLRYWPGTQEGAERIFKEVTEGSPNLFLNKLPTLLSKLDKQSDLNELEMEKERLTWELDDLNHDMLETFFERNSVKNKLSFSDFVTWESVQEEIWYNEKGINEKGVAEIWEKIAGCDMTNMEKKIWKCFRMIDIDRIL